MTPTPDDAPRPSFARDFPSHPALDTLVEAFARGDYRRVRKEAPKLAISAEAQNVRDSAAALLERTRTDPLMVWLLVLAGVLLMLLTAYWATHGKAPAAHPVEPAAGVRVNPPARSNPGSP